MSEVLVPTVDDKLNMSTTCYEFLKSALLFGIVMAIINYYFAFRLYRLAKHPWHKKFYMCFVFLINVIASICLFFHYLMIRLTEGDDVHMVINFWRMDTSIMVIIGMSIIAEIICCMIYYCDKKRDTCIQIKKQNDIQVRSA